VREGQSEQRERGVSKDKTVNLKHHTISFLIFQKEGQAFLRNTENSLKQVF